MLNYDLLKKTPYYLNDSQIKWVRDTIASMSKEEKIGQLFCLISYDDERKSLEDIVHKYKAGGIMGRPMHMDKVCNMTAYIQKEAKIPLLIAANLESGGDGLILEGTNVGPNMQIGATGDSEMARKQGHVCAKEGLACGANWAFAPVIDINMNFRNPIVATRSFGSDAKFVSDCGTAYVEAVQKQGMAASIKHFPGDGVDERDQHVLTSVNTMSCEEWDQTFGVVYKNCIDAGALTLMAAHIMLPAYSRRLRPDIKDGDIMPSTLAPELLNDLLRDRLGFNGMIVTDASSMLGLTIPMPRKKLVPYSIAAGCDMFLFAKNLDEDYRYMTEGVDTGVISSERLDEAVMRILGVKQSLGLIERKNNNSLIPNIEDAKKIVGCRDFKSIELECADKAVTLVKNLDNIIPISPEQYKRVLLYPINMKDSSFGAVCKVDEAMREALKHEGFITDIFTPSTGIEGMTTPASDITDNYDLIIYACNLETKSYQTTIRIEWDEPRAANAPSYINSIPTIFISFANPFHLIDVPRIRTFINAYKFKQTNVNAVIDKLMGRSEFKGVNPADPYCNLWDTRL